MSDLEALKRLAREAEEDRNLIPGVRWQVFRQAASPAAVLALIERVERAEALAERRRIERAEALTVHTKEGLLASEWVARTGRAERRAKDLEALARDGLSAYHGTKCLAGRAGQQGGAPKDCWDPTCREWAAALEGE